MITFILGVMIVVSVYHLITHLPSSFTSAEFVPPAENPQPKDAELDLDLNGEPPFTTYKEIIERNLAECKCNEDYMNSPEREKDVKELREYVQKNQEKADKEMKIEDLEQELKKLREQKYKSVCDMA